MKEKAPSEQEVEILLQPFNILLRSCSAMLDYDLAFSVFPVDSCTFFPYPYKFRWLNSYNFELPWIAFLHAGAPCVPGYRK